MADINGVGRIGTVLSSALSTALKKNTNSHERDAERHSGHGQQEAEHHLSPEQEEAALKKLQELDSFKNAGLSAKIIREAGKAPHIIVLSAEGNVIRQLPYQSIVNIYLEPKTENQSGFLLKKTA